MGNCPVCDVHGVELTTADYRTKAECSRCGTFIIDRALADDLVSEESRQPSSRLKLSFWTHLKTRAKSSNHPIITRDDLEAARKTFVRAYPSEQADELILAIAEEAAPGIALNLVTDKYQSRVRAFLPSEVDFLIRSLIAEGLLDAKIVPTNERPIFGPASITFKGWRKVETLRKELPNSKTAFIAMQFGDATLDNFVETHLRGCVGETGFQLLKVNDRPKAGLIDDKIRLDIRAARFLLADLSHDNAGAYWEAGYAEGLGKPVIYLCDQSKWDKKPSHFDTNHHTTVMWDTSTPAAIADFGERLKATIRYSIPEALQKNSTS